MSTIFQLWQCTMLGAAICFFGIAGVRLWIAREMLKDDAKKSQKEREEKLKQLEKTNLILMDWEKRLKSKEKVLDEYYAWVHRKKTIVAYRTYTDYKNHLADKKHQEEIDKLQRRLVWQKQMITNQLQTTALNDCVQLTSTLPGPAATLYADDRVVETNNFEQWQRMVANSGVTTAELLNAMEANEPRIPEWRKML